MVHVGDITRLDGAKLPPVDIITFGSPCQGLSLAGLRRGLADERSGLFMEAIRIIDEMREATHGEYPKFAIWENVVGATSSATGRDYQAVLAAFTKSKVSMPRSGKWANAGMARGRGVDLAWCVYDAQHFGTAQRRRRLFLVADFRGKSAGEILFVPKSLRGYFEAGGTPRQGLAAFAENGTDTAGGVVGILNDQGSGYIVHPQPAGTLCASGGLSRPTGMTSEVDFCIASAGFRYKAAATSGSVGYQEETAPTLVAKQPSGVLRAFSIGAYCSKGMLSDNPTVGYRETDTARTLDLSGGNPCCQQGGIAVVNAVDCRNLREIEETSGTLQAKTKSGGYSLNYQNPVRIGLNVRRLTPLEDERLMGFPDFWTQYGHDGREISDSKRYSMLGNSIAVPCAAYIMQGIRDALLREEAQ